MFETPKLAQCGGSASLRHPATRQIDCADLKKLLNPAQRTAFAIKMM
jgi:hypothetical protein